MIVANGRWRPVQGSINALVLFIGTRGLIMGPQEGQPLEVMTGNIPGIIYTYYSCILLGGLISTIGEIIQLRAPIILCHIDDYKTNLTGLIVEAIGQIILGLNFLAYCFAIYSSVNVPDNRSLPYIFLGTGILLRGSQCLLNVRRMWPALQGVNNGIH